eukprot:357723-Chlamydomonas_euryale.AAC.31
MARQEGGQAAGDRHCQQPGAAMATPATRRSNGHAEQQQPDVAGTTRCCRQPGPSPGLMDA